MAWSDRLRRFEHFRDLETPLRTSRVDLTNDFATGLGTKLDYGFAPAGGHTSDTPAYFASHSKLYLLPYRWRPCFFHDFAGPRPIGTLIVARQSTRPVDGAEWQNGARATSTSFRPPQDR